ncbi:hypothetical protein T439DRAFT_130085 [Meredithblackwellia eburnea MCA 4105]
MLPFSSTSTSASNDSDSPRSPVSDVAWEPAKAKRGGSRLGRKRQHTSCEPCRARKVKCDRLQVCSSCKLHHETCFYKDAKPTTTDYEGEELVYLREEIKRLRLLVSMLTGALGQSGATALLGVGPTTSMPFAPLAAPAPLTVPPPTHTHTFFDSTGGASIAGGGGAMWSSMSAPVPFSASLAPSTLATTTFPILQAPSDPILKAPFSGFPFAVANVTSTATGSTASTPSYQADDSASSISSLESGDWSASLMWQGLGAESLLAGTA